VTSSVRIIAEVAQGYEGRPLLGDLLIKAAAAAGADAVKFQIVFADDVAVPEYRYYRWYKQLEMPLDSWLKLRDVARARGLAFYADLSGERAFDLARQLSLDGAKIHSGNFFNERLVSQALETFPDILVSTGGIFVEEIERFIERHRLVDRSTRVSFMFGFQAEPTPIERNELARIPVLRKRLCGFELGFMDHTDGAGPDTIFVSVMAQAFGVRLFEKHLTLDRALQLEDYASALPPGAFAAYVQTLKRLTAALGAADTQLNDAELSYRKRIVKKLLPVRALPAGHTLLAVDLLQRRIDVEGDGFCYDLDAVIGRTLTRAKAVGEPLIEGDVA
jgi:N,N'-diacetyllegionaminate synthase